ncbi:MAG: extensin family protein [Myxococcales bacterium]|nr:MAG: extensin family protein [Myxococcales bacterium]
MVSAELVTASPKATTHKPRTQKQRVQKKRALPYQSCRKIRNKAKAAACIRRKKRMLRKNLVRRGKTRTHRTSTTAAKQRNPIPQVYPELSFLQQKTAASDIPTGKAIASTDSDTCKTLLKKHDVEFTNLDPDEFQSIEQPLSLQSDIGGITVHTHGGHEDQSILDCRLALAILAWSPILRGAGVIGIEHFSIYRPGATVAGTSKQSGHATGLAIDLSYLRFEEDTSLNVLDHWETYKRNTPPCASYPEQSEANRLFRDLVCEAFHRGLFQVVLTPHFNKAHRNHVHLELVPEVDWTYLR